MGGTPPAAAKLSYLAPDPTSDGSLSFWNPTGWSFSSLGIRRRRVFGNLPKRMSQQPPFRETPMHANPRNMFTMDVIEPENRRNHVEAVVGFYQLRHEVFVREMGWDLPLANDEFEIDQFDRPDTVYVLIRDAGQKV